MKIVYIAGPYRAPTRWEQNQNIHNAEEVAIRVARRGDMPVCPHANTRPYFEDVQGDEFWIAGTLALLERCDVVMTVPGWERSRGARGEVARAKELGIPVEHATMVGTPPEVVSGVPCHRRGDEWCYWWAGQECVYEVCAQCGGLTHRPVGRGILEAWNGRSPACVSCCHRSSTPIHPGLRV